MSGLPTGPADDLRIISKINTESKMPHFRLPRIRHVMLLILTAMAARETRADVRVPNLFSDHMVLQRGIAVPVWGWADPGEKVTVTFVDSIVVTTADASGSWSAKLPAMPASLDHREMTISGKNTLSFKEVLVGDVWLCGGQSNMDMVVNACDRAEDAISAITPNMRLSWGGGWSPASGKENGGFSGTGYWFGRYLAEQMPDIPIGLIKCAVGGSTAEIWSPGGELYKTRLAPLMPFALKGVVWYQGEANTDRPDVYSQAMEHLISAWRKGFESPALPFVFMQLPRIGGEPAADAALNPKDAWALTREAQTFNLAVPHTVMAIYSDFTDGDLHSKAKPQAGMRLAMAALTKVYGRKPAENYLSPSLKHATLQNGMLTLGFDNAAQGLKVNDAVPGALSRQFVVVSADGVQKPAQARLEGSEIIVDLRDENGLPDVYYSFSSYPMGNIINEAGLPVSPFRLAKHAVVVDDCIGNTITLRQDVPFGVNALRTTSYRIPGYGIEKIEYAPNNSCVRLTVNRAVKIGSLITIELPGFKQWDGKSGFKPLSFVATPGHVSAGGFFQEMLVGEIHNNVKPEEVFKENLIDVARLEYPTSQTWRLVKAEAMIPLAEGAEPPTNSLGMAHVYVYSATERTANLWYGSDDGARVFVNKELVNTSEGVRGCSPDSVKVNGIKLRKGWNSVFFEVSQFASGWAVMARMVDDNGGPLQGIGYQAEKPADFK
jgi:sialate O-acetylesterase